MDKPSFRRRQYLIKPVFQLKISSIIGITLLIATFITAATLYFNILNSVLPEFSTDKLKMRINTAADIRQRQVARYSAGIREEREFDMFFPETAKMLSDYERGVVMEILYEVNQKLVPWIFVLLGLIISFSIFLTHRIAGPVYRFEETMKRFIKGDMDVRIHLRWADEFQRLAKLINEAISSFSQREKMAKDLLKKIADVNQNLKKNAAQLSSATEKIKGPITQNEQYIAEMAKLLDFYKNTK
ncbi:MAG: methyl-accepting chemotaxis protein [Candidatus Omnitrophica bacterium]|nr:methyl-accepting chemotaxis protein [Candidatus Omnitrophota bacterium]